MEHPAGPLRTVFADFGLSEAGFDACLEDQKVVDGITWVRDRAYNELNVKATPTFFINGTMHVGGMSFDELDRLIRPLI